MPSLESEATLQQSMLDRLLDYEPKNRTEARVSRAQSLRQFKSALRRDLEWLLNTRRTPEAAFEDTPQLARSVYNYGLPDTSSVSLNSPTDQARLLRNLEEALQRFEPRLQQVQVSMLSPTANSRTVHFQIEGLLRIDPAPERICFDTVLELTRGDYQVEGEHGA
jgi:type VI secretion system protein ImpF